MGFVQFCQIVGWQHLDHQEVWWKHRFHLSLSDGFFEFVEEQMQLEHGLLAEQP